jgi:proteasome assembly chaperone (PAC2) family protein
MSGLNRTSIKELSRINVRRWESGEDSAVLGVAGLLLLLGHALLGDGLLLGGLGA